MVHVISVNDPLAVKGEINISVKKKRMEAIEMAGMVVV
jgi:hypothetical protein